MTSCVTWQRGRHRVDAGDCLSTAGVIFQLQRWIKSGSPQGLKVGQRFRSSRLKESRSDLVNRGFRSTSGCNTDLSGNWLVRTGLFLPGRWIVITSRRLLWQDLHDRSTWWWCTLLFPPSLPLSRFLSREKVSCWCAAQTRLNLHFPLREALNYGADESSQSKNGTLKGKTPRTATEGHERGLAEWRYADEARGRTWRGFTERSSTDPSGGVSVRRPFISCVKISEVVWGE